MLKYYAFMIGCCTAVSLFGSEAPPEPERPSLKAKKTMPHECCVCEPIPVRISVTNPGTASVPNVNVTERLPPGMKVAGEKEIFAINFGEIKSNRTKSCLFTAKVEAPGLYINNAVARIGDTAYVSMVAETKVGKPEFKLTKTTQDKQVVGKNITYCLTLKNIGDRTSHDSLLTDSLPNGAEFVSATDSGVYKDGSVTWKLGAVPATASLERFVTVKLRGIGKISNTAVATDRCAHAEASCETESVGIAALLLEVVDSPDPVEVGGETVYTITVTNQGTAVDENIRIACEVEDGVKLMTGIGPTTGTTVGNKIEFRPLKKLFPKGKAVWRITVKGEAILDSRFKVKMISDQMRREVEETEATNFY